MGISTLLSVEDVGKLVIDASFGRGPSIDTPEANEAYDIILNEMHEAPDGAIWDQPSDPHFSDDDILKHRSLNRAKVKAAWCPGASPPDNSCPPANKGGGGGKDKSSSRNPKPKSGEKSAAVTPPTPPTGKPTNAPTEKVNQTAEIASQLQVKFYKALDEAAGGSLPLISDAHRQQYKDAISTAIKAMPPAMLAEIAQRTGSVDFYDSPEELTYELKVKFNPEDLRPGDKVAGAYVSSSKDPTGSFELDGGSDVASEVKTGTTREVYAHEMGHAVDYGGQYSNSPNWQSAWQSEIKQPGFPLSGYAANFGPNEGFAEYVRLVNVDPKAAEEKFPECWSFLQRNKLV